MNGRTKTEQRILEAIREGARDLFSVGAIDAAKMSEFDGICRDGERGSSPDRKSSRKHLERSGTEKRHPARN